MIDGTLVDSLVGGAVTGALAVATMKIMLDRVFRRQDRSDARIDDLEDRRVTQIERTLEKVQDGGCSVGRTIAQKIDQGNALLTKLDLKLDRIAEDTASQAAKIEANHHYIENLDKSLQRHKEAAHG